MAASLRLTQTTVPTVENRYRVEVALEGDGLPRQTATSEFDFTLSSPDQADLRWYLEDFLQHPHEPAPTIAKRIEGRMAEIGEELFKAVFQSSEDARDLWATLRANVNSTRVEINTGAQEATAIPWELLRDSRTDVHLALRAASFVRTHSNPAQRPQWKADATGEVIRILLVICRPGGRNDVAFRSVASRILKGLGAEARAHFQLDVLRPATFEALGRTLRDAKAAGQPYHIVHFDGHGTYTAAESRLPGAFSPSTFGADGKRGYLVFEGGGGDGLIDGEKIGNLLVETGTPILVLNACQSAYAEAPEEPPAPDALADVHSAVRAFGSLAQTVMDTGVAGVVAWRYNVYVVTAAQFMAELYRSLVNGESLGGAVTRGRKNLADKPHREIGYAPMPLQDWMVPVVYEAAPLRLFQRHQAAAGLNIQLTVGDSAPKTEVLPDNLPAAPDAGFLGRDETLLALDRAFDTDPIVLLHALAGSGKTSTAAEFARWYSLTGGLGGGPVIFSSFQRHKPLARLLDDFGAVFGPSLRQAGIQWSAIDDPAARRAVALQVLQQVPTLWIWDNVEPIAGFPEGTESAWSAEEQSELVDFLRAARGGRGRFLLTSRRAEEQWLGNLPRRVAVPPMPMYERVALAKALAEKQGHRLSEVGDWRPLLQYTQGNPLTLTVLVNQALENGLTTRQKIDAFVADLRTGEATIKDVDEKEGRTSSLAASLSYGFEAGFSLQEKSVLALLHLFQGFVDVDVLRYMGAFKDDSMNVEAVRDLTREAGIPLLTRAAEAGLLTEVGNGLYTIHPALPWYFRQLFETHYPNEADRVRAIRAWVWAEAYWANDYAIRISNGDPRSLPLLAAEEDNLLTARRLALANLWLDRVTNLMQGLREVYERGGRDREWAWLVEELVPVFCQPETDLPLPGVAEQKWGLVIDYRVRLVLKARRLDVAVRLQQALVEVNRRRAAEALAQVPDQLDDNGRALLRSLAASLVTLGQIQMEHGEAACVQSYEQAAELLQRIGDRTAEAIATFNLGNAYKDIPSIRDLEQAERWYKRDLELQPEGDHHNKAKSLGQLGLVAYERFKEARAAQADPSIVLQHLNQALNYYQQALDLLPPDALTDLAVTHNQLGNIYAAAGQIETARGHYDRSIHYKEASGNSYGAALTRENVAIDLLNTRRFPDALLYAEAALRGFQSSHNADANIAELQRLIEAIKQAMAGG
ncbi:MAG: CHAT domain-containing protein [Anaerolineae bacterium]|nr:CHAT domain-containing protein [Anaerolineae bacterium]